MNDSAKTILWLGLIMIMFQVFKSWSQIKTVIFGGEGSGSAAVNIPVIPFGSPSEPEGEGSGEEPAPEEPAPELPPIEVASFTHRTA